MTDTKTNPATAAAIIFQNELLGEIGEENKRLKDDAARLQPLLDHIQKVDLIAVTNEEPIEMISVPVPVNPDGTFTLDGTADRQPGARPAQFEIISTVKLSQGLIAGHGDDERLIIPVVSSHDILVENLGFAGGVGINVANKRIGLFPGTFRRGPGNSMNIADSAIVHIAEEDDTAHLTIYISENVCIKGELKKLSNDDIIKFKEETPNGGYSHISYYLSNTNGDRHPTFTPTSIAMDLTPMLRETLDIVGKATASSQHGFETEDRSPSEELRHLTITALGNDSHKNMLNENHTLKLQRDAFMNIREKIMSVDISHSGGTMSFSLEEGEPGTDEDGNSIWRIAIAGKEHSSMPVHCINDSAFSVSGVQWNSPNGDLLGNVQQGQGIFINTENARYVGLCIPYTFGVEVLGVFNWNDQNDDEMSVITDSFFDKIRASVSGFASMTNGDRVEVPAFPETFRLQLTTVRFSQRSIEHVLRMVGVGDELVSNVGDAV